MPLLRNKKVITKPILKKFGKKREPFDYVSKHIIDRNDVWGHNGTRSRFRSIFLESLEKKPIHFLQKCGKEKPTVMFLGPGKGGTITEFLKFTSKLKINPVVDVFALTKHLPSEVNSIIRNDYSNNVPFEHLNVKSSKYKFLDAKYDLIVSAMGVGAHTKYTANALFTSALMLQKGGKAYIQTNMWHYLLKSVLDAEKKKLLIKNVFNRMAISYNKILEKSNLNRREYSFNFLENNNLGFVEIERIK